MALLRLTVGALLPTFRSTGRGRPRPGKERLRPLWIATHPGARFPGEWHGSPERAAASAKAFSGFLASGVDRHPVHFAPDLTGR